MLSRNKLALFFVVALGAAFAAGITHLFVLQFQSGTIYPPYSTLRADPLGAKAFYDSLDALPGLEMERHFRAVKRLPHDRPFTFFYAGVPIDAQWETSEITDLEHLIWSGMRLVMTFSPITEKTSDSVKKTEKKGKDPEPLKILGHNDFASHWGLRFAYLDLHNKNVASLSASRSSGSGESTIAWRTIAAFGNLDSAWHALYQCEGKPVVIERAFGEGTIVLCADSYFLSNEALGKHRAPAFLAWLAGESRRVIFDELHHGISDRAGVMTLARRHGMFPFFGALLVLGALFIWKNIPLMPPRAEGETEAVLAGKDSSAGFINLLRRNIEPRDLPGECWRAWSQSFIHQKRVSPTDLARAESLATAPQRDVLATMRDLAALLNKRTK